MAKGVKKNVEILLVEAQLSGLPEKRLLKSRHLGSVELIWPRTGIARKSAAREMVFRKGKVDFSLEAWTKRVLFREEIEGHCGLAVSLSESVTAQKIRKFAKLTARLALKEGADLVTSAMVGYGDIAAAPIDALATMVGESEAPKSIAQGAIDVNMLPSEGEEKLLVVPLYRPLTGSENGRMTLLVRG